MVPFRVRSKFLPCLWIMNTVTCLRLVAQAPDVTLSGSGASEIVQ